MFPTVMIRTLQLQVFLVLTYSSGFLAKDAEYKYAICNVKPNPSKPNLTDNVTGQVHFKQKVSGGSTMMLIQLSGFDTADEHKEHGFHIHSHGTIEEGCEGAGGHYNPSSSFHGSPQGRRNHRHTGDLGSVIESRNGTVFKGFTDDQVSLISNQSVMGRTVVVHYKQDDLGKGGDLESLRTGNAGTRLACCVTSATSRDFWKQ